MKLRPHQKKDYKEYKKLNHQHILWGAATGYGKSIIILKLVKKAKGNVLIIAPRRKLVRQLKETLIDYLPNIVMGSDSADYGSHVTIACTSSLTEKRLQGIKNIDLVIIDEVHMNFDGLMIKRVKDKFWDKAKWIGLSATPIDARGYRLEGWDHTLYNHQTRDLIQLGYLKDVEVLVEEKPKGLEDIDLVAGDYSEGDLGELMSDNAIISNIYKLWNKYAKNKKTMIFAVTITHAELIYDEFIAKGVKAGVVHSKRNEDEEDMLLQQFSDDEIDVIINVGKLTTGFDETSVDCLILARPTKSLRLYLQIVGRGLRQHKGKPICTILDLAGCVQDNHYPTMMRDFNAVKPEPRESDLVMFTKSVCDTCDYEFQMNNCRLEKVLNKQGTKRTWYCPSCDNIIKQDYVENKKIKKLKKMEDYTDTSKITGADVASLIDYIIVNQKLKSGFKYWCGESYKKNEEPWKILVNKFRMKINKEGTIYKAMKDLIKL